MTSGNAFYRRVACTIKDLFTEVVECFGILKIKFYDDLSNLASESRKNSMLFYIEEKRGD